MIFKSPFKRIGFTMMEVLLAVFIVGILAAVTIPIISRQLEKSDEYSYYLAYRTVEKMAGQIVAQGDPKDVSYGDDGTKIAHGLTFKKYLSDKFTISMLATKSFFKDFGNRIVATEALILTKFMPKSVAEVITTEDSGMLWSSATYDDVWLGYQVCVMHNGSIPKSKKSTTVTNPETGEQKTTETVEYYVPADFDDCSDYKSHSNTTGSGDSAITTTTTIFDYFRTQFFGNQICSTTDANVQTFMNIMGSQTSKPDAQAACNNAIVTTACGSVKNIEGTQYSSTISYQGDDEDDEDSEDTSETEDGSGYDADQIAAPSSAVEGICSYNTTIKMTINTDAMGSVNIKTKKFDDTDCSAKKGWIGAYNSAKPNSIACECSSGLIPSANSERACFAPCTGKGETLYARKVGETYLSRCCTTDFNETTGACCPKNSTYDSASGKCVCLANYGPEGVCNTVINCSKGSTKSSDGVCVVNPPIINSKHFCELITDNWNTSSTHCDGVFSTVSGSQVNTSVYNAAVGTNDNYLSIKSKVGAFKDLTPNIVFANGLRLWILGDKAASIPGLSATPTGATNVQNMCKKVSLTNTNAAACTNAGGYFCKSENSCMTFADSENATVDDARGCCSNTDLTDYAKAAMASENPDDYQKASVAYAISGFTVFVDINGDKGNGTLWDDVYPFYISANGTVYPAYPLDAKKGEDDASNSLYIGGNSEKQLPVDVYYYITSGDNRKKVLAFPNVSFARAMCSARKISKYTPYCLNLGEKYQNTENLKGTEYIANDDVATSKNPCDKNNCFIVVKRKSKQF